MVIEMWSGLLDSQNRDMKHQVLIPAAEPWLNKLVYKWNLCFRFKSQKNVKSGNSVRGFILASKVVQYFIPLLYCVNC